jgi:hypothetical protein
MSFRSGIPAFVLFVFSALPFAACSSGDASPNAGTCSAYCTAGLACATPDTCVLSDPAGAQEACITSCEAGIASLSPTDRAAFDPCIACVTQAAAGMCLGNLPKGTCDAQCNTTAANTATDNFGKAAMASPATAMAECTNGKNALGSETCSGSGDSTSCSSTCCNGSSCSTPEVGFTCTGASLDMCTCTAGKNKGKAFQGKASCGSDPWTACNL